MAFEGFETMLTTYNAFKKRMAHQERAVSDDRRGHEGFDWCSFGAIAGLSGGIIAALLGSVATAITWFLATGAGSYIHTLGTILLFITIPLLILGAHCLDRLEKRTETTRKCRLN